MKKLKILVIDDSDFLREAIKKFLENIDLEVITISNGVEGIRYALQEKPDLIFLDLMMPNFNGIDVLKSIKTLNTGKEIPVVIITAHKDNSLIEDARQLGAAKLIYKPLNKRSIYEAIDEFLGEQLKQWRKYAGSTDDKDKNDSKSPDFQKAELRNHMLKIFLKFVDLKIIDIKSSIEAKNPQMLKSIVHELRGAGTTIGYSRLTMLGEYVEGLLEKELDQKGWENVTAYAGKVLEMLEIIKVENTEN